MIYIKEKIDKNEVAEMEVVTFDGRIIVIQTELEAEKAVNYLLTQPIVGIDTETRPSFKRGVINKVALLQVSTYAGIKLYPCVYGLRHEYGWELIYSEISKRPED